MADSSRKGDILKVRLGDDIRRMVLYNTHISYDDLVLMLQRVYNGKLKSSDDVALKYYDEGMAPSVSFEMHAQVDVGVLNV